MTSLEDRQQMSELITLAGELCGLSERTLQRWRSRQLVPRWGVTNAPMPIAQAPHTP